uniref:beta-glucosidase n=1 Tax=Kuraishia capsulata TaxID=317047 RepID=Q12653_9ASCO|nr:beta-glucosidase [Kuraishia capsulata]
MKSTIIILSVLAAATAKNISKAEMENLEHWWSYGRSDPVYPSPEISGLGDWQFAYQRAREIVALMTNEEKTNLTFGSSGDTGCSGMISDVPDVDFPGLCLQDAGNGVRGTDMVNAYASGLHVGASWNRQLAYDRAVYMGAEFRHKGVNVLLGPVVGPIGRVATGGRNWEGFTNDPYLAGALVYETTKGIQENVIACTKHFIGNEQETNRNPSGTYNQSVSANIDDKTMHELYLWPFQDSVRAGLGSIMGSYNRVNNSYACKNSKVLNGLLKSELGFQGFVVSDWGGQHTGIASANAGLDMAMPSSTYWEEGLIEAVKNGTVDQSRLDDMATRIIAAWYKYARLDDPGFGMPVSLAEDHELVDARDPAAASTIFQGAVEGHVLVKNENALPLKKPKYISLFGYDGVSTDVNTVGGGFSFFSFDVKAIENKTLISGGGSGTNTPSYVDAPFNAFVAKAREDNTFLSWDFTSAEPVANPASDACIDFINAAASEGYDRPNLADKYSDKLVEAVASQCSNTIVVIHNAGIRLVDNWIEHENVTGVILAHLPGQDTGTSLIEVLYGNQSPSGRLPYTVAKKASDYGGLLWPTEPEGDLDLYFPQSNFTEGVYIDYKYFIQKNITPRYEFGYGLTYTTFDYSELEVDAITNQSYLPPDCTIEEGGAKSLWDIVATVKFTVTNTGDVAAAEVPQLYVGIPNGPPKVLRGFDKKLIHPGQSEEFVFELTRRDLSTWDVVAQNWGLQAGTYQFYVGRSVFDVPLTSALVFTN